MRTDIMIRFPVHVTTLCILLMCACASNRVPIYVAPSSETIDTGTEMTLSGDGQYVYVFNHSSVAIIVTGLHLVACENIDRKSTRLNSSHGYISYAVFCLKKKNKNENTQCNTTCKSST